MRKTMKIVAASGLMLAASLSMHAQLLKPTPAPEDVPTPVPGEVSLAGALCPDITRFLNVRSPGSPELSPDGTRLSFITNVTGQPQLWMTQVREGGSWPVQLTYGDESVTFSDWSPAGDWIAYGMDRAGNERPGFYVISPDGLRERELLPPSESFRVWGGFSRDGAQFAFAATDPGQDDFDIYVARTSGEAPRRVLEGRGGMYVVSWRPDGKGLVLHRTRGEDANDLFYLDLESGALTTLFEPKEAASYRAVEWLPDSSGFYFVTNQDRDFEGLAFFDFAKRQMRWIENPPRDVEDLALSADGRYLFWGENANGYSVARLRDFSTGTTQDVDLPRGVIGTATWAPRASRLAIELAGPAGASLLALDAPSARVTRITGSSFAGLDPSRFVTPEAVSFPSHDGETIYGLLYLPPGASPERKPPVVLLVHGGPTSQARTRFNPVGQYLLSRGYALLDLNFRGSTGYGKRFARLDNQRLRPNAVRDMQAAIDWLRRTQPVDTSRAAVMGGSYGGYMTFAALTQLPKTFKAGVSFVGVSNWITALEGASPQLKASDLIEYGNIDDPADREFFRQLSPLTHVDNVRAPVMVLHGANDPRDPVDEADQFVRAVRERGGEVEYLRFPDEGHGIRRLSNRIIAYRRIVPFLDRTLGPGLVKCD